MSAEYYRQGWRVVAGGIDGASEELAAFEARFVENIEHGLPLHSLEKELGALLDGIEWSWSWLDECQRRFEQSGLWPYLWPDFRPDDDEIDDYDDAALTAFRRGEAVPLIIHTAMTISYRLRDLDGLFRPSTPLRLVSMGDEAEDWASQPFAAQIEAGDRSVLPPFFPGDRTTVALGR